MKCGQCGNAMSLEYDGKTIRIWKCPICGRRQSEIPKRINVNDRTA